MSYLWELSSFLRALAGIFGPLFFFVCTKHVFVSSAVETRSKATQLVLQALQFIVRNSLALVAFDFSPSPSHLLAQLLAMMMGRKDWEALHRKRWELGGVGGGREGEAGKIGVRWLEAEDSEDYFLCSVRSEDSCSSLAMLFICFLIPNPSCLTLVAQADSQCVCWGAVGRENGMW